MAEAVWWYEHQRCKETKITRKGKCTFKADYCKSGIRYRDTKRCELKKLLSPYKRNAAVGYVLNEYKVSERRACAVLDINRTAFRYEPIKRDDEDEIREKIIEKACNYGRTGYRQVTSMLRNDGILINHKRVERIWGEEGLKRPAKQSKKRRLWLNDGSCIRLRAEYKNHVWSYDFVHDKTVDGKKFRILNIIDEASRECLASVARRRFRNNDIIEILADLMVKHGTPEYLRSDNGIEFTAKKLMKWLSDIGVITTFIEPGSPWENGYCESFNSRMRDEFLNGEIFGNIFEAKVLTKRWMDYYNTIRPHSALGGRPPAPQSISINVM